MKKGKKTAERYAMCELFGFSAPKAHNLTEDLKRFYAHSVRNPHGWGLAVMNENKSLIEKEPKSAVRSDYLKERLKTPVIGKTVFGHIRYATIGNVEPANCHPFTGTDDRGRTWTLIHNGTIFDYDHLSPYLKAQKGETDSERILLFLVDVMNRAYQQKGGDLDDRERFTILDRMISDMAEGNKLNLLIFDGSVLYVHTNCERTLFSKREGDGTMFATVPIDEDDWQSLPMTRLLGYRSGERIFTGTNHGNEYFPNKKEVEYLYLSYSNL